jgi:hypothetical protein
MANKRSPEDLVDLFESKTVVDLPSIRECLGSVSEMTAFRYLRQVPYRRSYNHNGRFYARHDPSRYDRFGLWSWGDVHFSQDGSLRDTARRLVHESEVGCTHRELQERLRVRVQNTLLDLYRKGEVERERLAEVYVYLHIDSTVREEQLHARRERIAEGEAPDDAGEEKVSDDVVIQVLLTLIRHPGSSVADVVRHLRGHAPPIKGDHVRVVFDRYDLGEKRGSPIC